jgi:hypothetical protein
MSDQNKRTLKTSAIWLLPFAFTIFLYLSYRFFIYTYWDPEDMVIVTALTQTQAITMFPIFIFLTRKKVKAIIQQECTYAFWQSAVVALSYAGFFLKREFTPLLTLILFGWCLIWSLLPFSRRSFGKGLKPYGKYYLPFLFAMISGIGFFLLTTTSMIPEFQCTVIFLLNIILIFLPIVSFQYGRITGKEKNWFILYQTLITGFPYTILLWNGTKAFLYHNLIFFGWIALWGLLGRIKRKNKT